VTPELAVRTPYLFQPAEDKRTLKQLKSRQKDQEKYWQEFVTQYTRYNGVLFYASGRRDNKTKIRICFAILKTELATRFFMFRAKQ
jgi:hypothetical protein